MQTRALLLVIARSLAAKPVQPNHDWLSPSRSMVTVVAVERKCPAPDFELVNNDTCVKVLEIPAEASCNRPTALLQEDNSTCVTTEFYPPERVCPANAVFNGEECDIFNIQSAAPQCEPGDELINGECWRYETRTAQLSCPKTYQLKGDRCVFTASTTPDLVCPPDFKMNHDEICVKTDVKSVQPDCPEGSVYYNGLCVSELGLNAAKARPPLIAGQATINIPIPELPHNQDAILTPNKRCMSGGELDDQNRCVSITSVDADIVCPSGYAMNAGRCDKPVTSQPGYRCPANFVLQGDVCVQTVPAEPYCHGEKETLTTSGTCISLHSEPPIRSCPQRSMMSADGRCAVQVVYENDLELYCDPTSAHPSRLNRAASLGPPVASYALVNDLCVKVVKNRQVMICPPNYTFKQNQCVLAQAIPPQPECRNATYDVISGQCVSTTAVDQLLQCPKGFDVDSNTRSCRAKKLYHAQLTCPDGFTLRKKRGSSGNSAAYECYQHQVLPADSTCGEIGKLENSTCVHRVVGEAVKRCAEGFDLVQGMCQQTLETLVMKSCPADYKQVGNACVGKVPTETQTLTSDDRRLLIDALQGFALSKKSSGNSTQRKKSDTLVGAAAGSDMMPPVMSTNDQDLLSMAEILAKWQKSSPKKGKSS